MYVNKHIQNTFTPSDYPRTYVASTGNKFGAVLSACVISIGAAIALRSTLKYFSGAVAGEFIMPALLMLPILLLPLVAWSTFRFKIVLHPDRIDYQCLFASWSLQRNQIGSWRLHQPNRGKVLELTPSDASARICKCTLQCETDTAFNAWFAGLPNTDQLARQESLDAVRRNAAYGSTPEERISNAAHARKTASIAILATFGIMFWGIISPQPYMLPIWACLLSPLIALGLCWLGKGLYTLANFDKRAATADLTLLIILPGVTLLIRALQDGSMLDWLQTILPGASIAAVLVLLIGLTSKNAGRAMSCFPFCAMFGISAIILTNTMLDGAIPGNYPVKIIAHWQVRGKGVSYHIRVSAWGRAEAAMR